MKIIKSILALFKLSIFALLAFTTPHIIIMCSIFIYLYIRKNGVIEVILNQPKEVLKGLPEFVESHIPNIVLLALWYLVMYFLFF